MWLEIERFVKVTWIWGTDISSSWGGVPNRTLWMRLTCMSNLMLLGFPWLKNILSNWKFDYFEQFKINSYFAAFNSYFGQVTNILLSLGKILGHKKQSKASMFAKKTQEPPTGPGTIHFQWFSQQEARTGWVLQSINRLQRLSILFFSVTHFSNLCDKKICMVRIMTKSFT